MTAPTTPESRLQTTAARLTTTPESTGPRTLRATLATFLAHRSPQLLLAGTTVAVVARIAIGAWSPWDLLVAAAWFAVWPVQEWLIHVLILHFRPRTILGRRVDLFNARKHRLHHAAPNDLALVFIPPRTVLAGLPLLAAASFLLLPTPLAATSVATFAALALHYEWAHTLAHVPYTPNLPYYRRICRAHMLHHHRSEKAWFGVSRTLADTLFGTEPDAASIPPSDTVRTLGVSG